jgi:hypothetical protein
MGRIEPFKRSVAKQTGGRLGPIIHDDPFEEYRLRTGRDEAPPEDRIPVEAFHEWQHSDKG